MLGSLTAQALKLQAERHCRGINARAQALPSRQTGQDSPAPGSFPLPSVNPKFKPNLGKFCIGNAMRKAATLEIDRQ